MSLKQFLDRIAAAEYWWQPVVALLAGAGLIAFFTITHLHADREAKQAQAVVVATSTPNPAAFSHVSLIGQAAIVYDLKTGQTLYDQNADQPLPLASLTKLLTMYAAVTTLSPDSPVTITQQALDQYGDFGFTLGERFAFEDLARLTLVGSANDGAEAIAEAAANARAEQSTSLLANAATAAGLEHTTAENGTGLDLNATQAGAYGSARDVAELAGKLLQKAPDLAAATIQTSATIHDLDGRALTLPNTNQDVVHVPGILLSKTGYTDLAGGNLAVVFDAGMGHPVAVVVLGSTEQGRFTDVETLVHATLSYFAGPSSQP